ncbi:MAG: hypothetical protein D4R45_04500 [Planctomycetaceae bacterium]|nr:MAG: hypothetical protein D4R45_04500 [Planctomycetaceae bacterium]
MITMSVDTASFHRDMQRFRKRNEVGFRNAILKATLQMEKLAKMKVRNFTRGAKVKSSFLVNGIRKQITDRGLTGIVISSASYSQVFEEGSRPHTIRIKDKKVLAGPKRGAPAGWNINAKSASMGYAVYGKKVQHPGTSPHPFLFPAWRFAIKTFENLMRKAL